MRRDFPGLTAIYMTKKTKAAKDAIFAALPVAMIIRPLRFIEANTFKTPIKSPLGVTIGYEPSIKYQIASKAAKRGNGARVKMIARQVLAA